MSVEIISIEGHLTILPDNLRNHITVILYAVHGVSSSNFSFDDVESHCMLWLRDFLSKLSMSSIIISILSDDVSGKILVQLPLN